MRIRSLAFAILLTAFLLAVGREPAGRVGLIVFVAGCGELGLGLAAVMALFQAIGGIGMARGVLEHVRALAETALVLAVGTAAMTLWLGVGLWCLRASLP